MSWILRQFALALLVSTSVTAWAQHFIRGQVRYENGQPADRVVVRLRSDVIAFQTETQTDTQGKFNFDGLPLTSYHLTIEGQGFRPYSSHIDISGSKMAYELITLHLDKEPEAKSVPPEGPGGLLNIAIEQIPPDARKEYETGEKLLNEKKDLDGSVKHYRKAIQLYDKFPEAYLKLGLVYLDQKKFDESQAALQKSTELDPKSPAGYLALGTVYNQGRRYEDAEKVLTQGLELKPDVPEGQYELAKTYWALNRWTEAEPHALKAVALKPDLAPALVLLGNIALRKRDPQGALKEFQEYLRLEPNGPMAEQVRTLVAKIEKTLAAQ
jgi:tetratricopeptide (TPR) repeat protein